jgi:uncharacterized protein with von Willebrand factor type A (vWA) domain
MDARLVEFAGLLRAHGLPVAPAEVADAVTAAALVGVADRESFRAALRSTLAKRARDAPVFDGLFDLYFSGLGRILDRVEEGLVASLRESGLLDGEDLARVARTLERLLGGMSPLTRAALLGDRGLLAKLLRGAALQLDFGPLRSAPQVGFYGRRILAAAGGGEAEADLRRLEAALAGSGLEPARVELVAGHLRAALRGVEEAARRHAELEQRARAARLRGDAFLARPLAPVTRDEAARTEAAVRRLAERLQARLVRRERSRRRGAVAVRRTLRRNLGLGGVPARLVFRARRPQRPDVLVLCDVSESVRHVTRLMLLFLYTLQKLFARVRTFVFVSDLAEVSEVLKAEDDPARAADLATAARVVSVAANSNYGRALRTFHRSFLGAVTRRTTVIVVGDGRNNYNPTEAWVLDEVRRRARRLLWVCPEARSGWGSGDSEMPSYAARCDRVATVQSLAELEALAEALVPRNARAL